MRVALVWLLLGFTFVVATSTGCSSKSKSRPPAVSTDGDGGADDICIDDDGDGYGSGCSKGRDCNDNDPDVTTECRRCASANENCPCTPGTKYMTCVPPAISVDGGTLVCQTGTRYCRARQTADGGIDPDQGVWSACEQIGDYVFVPNH